MIKVVGTITTSCEEAAADAIKAAGPVRPGPSGRRGGQAGYSPWDGGELIYCTVIQLSFKYEQES